MTFFRRVANLIPRFWPLCSVIVLLISSDVGAQLNNDTSPTSLFRSRPDLHPPIIDFSILRPELITPGYIFIAPYRNLDPGPYIYDNWGQLVWSGAGTSGPKTAHTPRVCQYKGADHLCYFTGEQHQGFARGHGVIMDKHYRTVKTVEAAGAGTSNDMHEFRLTPYSNGTTALVTVFQPRHYDLSTNPRFNVKGGMGWIVEGVFQEIDIETGRLLFEWRSLDHIDPGEGWTMPGTTDTSGDGLTEQTPWDYFHINSIDKNIDGDYLISARHTSAIYKLSGQDGSIMWELGGANPTFEQKNFVFSYQHHARWMSETSTHSVISFFDNGSNGYNNYTAEFSHGWIVEIDHASKTATIIKKWGAPEPEGGLLSGSQGNMQLLPNGGCHMGWGDHAYFSEHTEDGTPTMYGKLASRPSNVMIYRSNKYNWTAEPLTKPALYTYSKAGKDKMVFFVSWNGATEVASWMFYTSDNANGPWSAVATEQRAGFETVHHSDVYSDWAYTQALDKNGKLLADSVFARTFVPSASLRKHCGDDGCDPAVKVEGDERTPYKTQVNIDSQYLSPNRAYDTSHYYHGDDLVVEGSHAGLTPTVSNDTALPTTTTYIKTTITATVAAESTAYASYSGYALFFLFFGVTCGFVIAAFLAFLSRRGALRRISPGIERITGRIFGDRSFKYDRVAEKDTDD